jgi:hypothetical protein
MLAPFVIVGIVFAAGALLWARHKGQISEKEVGEETLQRGGDQ